MKFLSLLLSLIVSQSRMVNATVGDSVTLECNYTINSSINITLGWYKWYRHLLHGDEVSNTTGYYKGRVSMASPSDFIEKASASITLHNLNISDTGMYVCEVNINEIISGHGNGTFLNVTGETIGLFSEGICHIDCKNSRNRQIVFHFVV
uniref:Natural cytotoxicity triggering receptor 3 n=1 Tax=Leptobrachium leishanense TaxID=445787 RepID=A0A8C5PXA4_9ANUR